MKNNELTEVNDKSSAIIEPFISKFTELSIEHLIAQRDALVAENSALKGAIEFAEPWLPSCDGELLHIISQAKITPATDAAIAEIKAQGVDEFADHMQSEKPFWEPEDWAMMDLAAEEAHKFAAYLRAGRKG